MKDMTRKGFTLVEIMIVVAIIGVLAAIAIPNFIRSRKTAQKNACIANLKSIEAAKEQALIDGLLVADWVKYVKGGAELKCPSAKSGNLYSTTAGDEGKQPKCPATVADHELPIDTSNNNP
ncbi:MAG: prepilin-type N-terminal cleavage/methylation domain-containing protein [Kiritimatiellia bacterium]